MFEPGWPQGTPSWLVGAQRPGSGIVNDADQNIPAQKLLAEFDAVVLAGGAEQPRDLPIPGWLVAVIAVLVVAAVVLLLAPGVRSRIRHFVETQVRPAWQNLRDVVATPRKSPSAS